MSLRIGATNTAFADDSCLEVVYRMYWLCYHIHTYKKTTVYDCQRTIHLSEENNVLKLYYPMFV
jgi:hypothetical protein